MTIHQDMTLYPVEFHRRLEQKQILTVTNAAPPPRDPNDDDDDKEEDEDEDDENQPTSRRSSANPTKTSRYGAAIARKRQAKKRGMDGASLGSAHMLSKGSDRYAASAA